MDRNRLCLVLCLCGCHLSPVTTPSFDTGRAIGNYSGNFGKGIVYLAVNYANSDIVSGFDYHRGVRRNLNGTAVLRGDHLELTLREPGDNGQDGTFILEMDTVMKSIQGKWTPLHRGDDREVSLSQVQDSDFSRGWAEDTPHDDALLQFEKNGYCEYRMSTTSQYESTEPDKIIRGTYLWKDGKFTVEWERNDVLPAGLMVLTSKPAPPYQPGREPEPYDSLKGGGFTFHLPPAAG